MAVHNPISRFATEPFVGVAGFEGPVRAERIKITPGHLAAATRRVRSGGRRELVMTTLDHDLLIAILDRLKLTAIRDQLDTPCRARSRSSRLSANSTASASTRSHRSASAKRIHRYGTGLAMSATHACSEALQGNV
nr:hypothetical protein [Mesorhizobium sp. LNHC220B00]